MYRHYSTEEKHLAIELYLLGHSSESIGAKLGIGSRRIRQWVNLYQSVGYSGFEKRVYLHYSLDLKKEVVREVLEKFLSCETVALKYNVSNSAVVTWVDKVRQFGYQSLAEVKKRGRPPKDMGRPKKQKPQSELEKLQEDNARLRAENALLKKVKALVEERDAQLRETGRKPSKN